MNRVNSGCDAGGAGIGRRIRQGGDPLLHIWRPSCFPSASLFETSCSQQYMNAMLVPACRQPLRMEESAGCGVPSCCQPPHSMLKQETALQTLRLHSSLAARTANAHWQFLLDPRRRMQDALCRCTGR